MILTPPQYDLKWYSRSLSRSPEAWPAGSVLGFSGTKEMPAEGLAVLDEFPPLFGVLLTNCGSVEIERLYKYPRMKFLSIGEMASMIDFGRFPDLEYLFTDVASGLSLNAHPNVRCLEVAGYPHADLSPLRAWPRLELLRLGGTRLGSLEGIQGLRSLRGCELQSAQRLKTIAAAKSARLEELRIEGGRDVSDWEALGSFRSLELLALVRSGTMNSLRPLAQLPKLRCVILVKTYVDDGDMSPLLGLETVSISWRRGYSHTPIELDRATRRRPRPEC